jgi:hypothetical protein
MQAMKLASGSLFVAIDRGQVEGGELRAGFRGPRLASFAAAPLASGALEPRPFETNIVDRDAVLEAVSRVLAALGARSSPVTLVLPDGTARTGLVEPPGNVAPDHFARFRLGQGLAFPASEAIVGTLKVAGGAHLAGLVWRRIVNEYEQVLADAGAAVARAELAPFLAVAGLGAGKGAEGGVVDVILGDAAYSLAHSDGGGLRAFRTRRRTRSADTGRIVDEAERTAMAAGQEPQQMRVVGRGASLVLAELLRRGRRAAAGWTLGHEGVAVEPVELVWAKAGA